MILPYLAFNSLYTDTIKRNTAILIFANGAHREASRKSFHAAFGRSENTFLADALNRHTIDTCNQTELPFFFHDHTCQKGSTFGHRLSHAFEQIFKKGFENVIAIGNDCPDLSTQDLITAHNSLELGKIVLGPAEDGGVYLIGINKKTFDEGILTKITWKTRNVFKELQESVNLPIELLSQKFDIDKEITPKIVRKIGGWLNQIWRVITTLLTPLKQEYQRFYVPINPLQTKNYRGPPDFI